MSMGEKVRGGIKMEQKSNMAMVKINMPKCCDDCPMNYDGIVCRATNRRFYERNGPQILDCVIDTAEERFPDCPIKQIPETFDIVRCGECKYWDALCWRIDGHSVAFTDPNDYCSYGKRKEQK